MKKRYICPVCRERKKQFNKNNVMQSTCENKKCKLVYKSIYLAGWRGAVRMQKMKERMKNV